MKFTDILMSSAHAYIVEGKGASRQAFVRKFIKGLNCADENPAARPCGTCPSCIQIDAGTSMDVVHMDKSGKTTYMVKDATAMIERLSMGSYGRHVIGVIDDADALSETIQNKLLKTLEEPEPGVVIILATNNADNLLSTVRSRCNLVRISDFEQIADEGSDANIDEAAEFILTKHNFYEYRELIDKKIKTSEDAVALLSAIEDRCHTEMLNGNRQMAQTIELIETTRTDIFLGMNYSKALRRLCLELA